jgi:hypothetical protein
LADAASAKKLSGSAAHTVAAVVTPDLYALIPLAVVLLTTSLVALALLLLPPE